MTDTMKRYRQHPNVASRIIDGKAYVVAASSNRFFGLGRAGAVLWKEAEQGCTTESAAAALVREFKEPLEKALKYAEEQLLDLENREILISSEV